MRLMKAAGLAVMCVCVSWAKFDPCRFNFGYKAETGNFSEADIVAQYTWSGTGLENDVRQMLGSCRGSGKTPALYMYIIAKSSGLGDCNTGGGLCSAGAEYIRNNKEKIKGLYRSYADAIRNSFGTDDPILLLMEPDYFQYAQPGNQNGNPLSFEEAGMFIGECIDIVKGSLPNALVSLDLSPWIEDQGVTDHWFRALPLSKVDFMNTSGGVSQASSTLIKGDNRLTWKKVHDATGKCIIADAGYGVGGGGTGHDAGWDDVKNVNSRISEGVLAIIQFSPKPDWDNTIRSISGQLASPICGCGVSYTLTVTATVGGTVTKSPDKNNFEENETVTLTAEPDEGYTFAGWSGDVSGSSSSVSVKMDGDRDITAEFIVDNGRPTYSLDVTVSGSGIVEIAPEKTYYDSGAVVTLTVYTVNGATFNGWSGALSGTGTLVTLPMNGNTSVTASFSGDDIQPVENLIKNGGFSEGTGNWSLSVYDNAQAGGSVVDGRYKVSAQNTGSELWNIQLTQGGIALEKGESYTLTFTASAESNTTIQVNIGMPAAPYESFSTEHDIELSAETKTYTIDFTMAKESTSDARLEFNAGKSSGSWLIDDVELAIQMSIDVNSPESYLQGRYNPPVSGNEHVVVRWFDHAGRLLRSVSGTRQNCMKLHDGMPAGSFIMVIQAGDRRIIRRGISCGR